MILAAGDCANALDTDVNPPEGGVILVEGLQVGSPHTEDINESRNADVEAVPNPGFLFSHWLDSRGERIQGDAGTSPAIVVDMSHNETRVAVFIPDPDFVLSALTALIVSPANDAIFQVIESIAFNGRGDDPEDGALTGDSLVWSSDLDGELGTGETFNLQLSAGDHVISLDITDSEGNTEEESVNIIVGGQNQPPTAIISSPVEGEVFLTSDSISFSGLGDDPEDGALADNSLVWVSNLDGGLGTGAQITASLNAGDHVIALDVTDSDGVMVNAFVSITVEGPVDLTPTATIVSPSLGDTFLTSDSIAFSGSANDPDGGPMAGVSLVWVSNLDGELGTGASINASLSAGNHVIALDATDSEGVTVSAFVGIIVEAPPNGPPTAVIVSPANGDTFTPADSIVFSGSANDPEDGPLIADALVWASNVDGQLGTGGSLNASLSDGHHTVSLTATDSQGVVGAEFVSITVEAPNAPPTASITSPVPGSSFETGVNIAFNGTGTDPEEGSLTGASLVWTSDFDGEIGTGESFSASLSAGSHIIMLVASDGQQTAGTATIAITVVAPEPTPVPTATPAPTATPVPQPVPLPERAPGLAPSLFTGSATLNGYLVPDGTVVTAWVADFSEPVATSVVADGKYVASVFQYGTKSFAGKTITFKIGGIAAQQTGSWETFGAEVLNLTGR